MIKESFFSNLNAVVTNNIPRYFGRSSSALGMFLSSLNNKLNFALLLHYRATHISSSFLSTASIFLSSSSRRCCNRLWDRKHGCRGLPIMRLVVNTDSLSYLKKSEEELTGSVSDCIPRLEKNMKLVTISRGWTQVMWRMLLFMQ